MNYYPDSDLQGWRHGGSEDHMRSVINRNELNTFRREQRRMWSIIWALMILAIAACAYAFLNPKPAHAAVLALPDAPSGYSMCSGGICVWGKGSPQGLGKIIQVPEPETALGKVEQEIRIQQWSRRCHPVIVPDQYGVGRYYYSAAGCEFGR